MFKKIFAGILVLALALSMCIIPAAADDFGANCFFDAEYRDGSLEDKFGAHMYDCSIKPDKVNDDDVPPIAIVESTDEDVKGVKVAQFRGGGIEYLYAKNEGSEDFTPDPQFGFVNNNFTMEMYVKIINTGWGMVAGTWYENSSSTAGWGIQMGYNAAIQGGIGAANQISVIDANGDFKQADTVHTTLKGTKARNKWLHIVLVNTNAQNTLYVNGECVGTEAAASVLHDANGTEVCYDCIAHQINSAFRVGGYRPRTNQFCLQMDCAYVRLYKAPATADQAKAMYDNRLGAAPSGGGDNPPAPVNPTPAPSGDATPVPDDKPTPAPSGDATPAPAGPTQAPSKPTQAPVNPPKTFDLGIVSIAAMSLSSLVVLKKKKK